MNILEFIFELKFYISFKNVILNFYSLIEKKIGV